MHTHAFAGILGLRWISGNTRKDKINNEVIYLNVRVIHIEKKDERERLLRWLDHMRYRLMHASVRKKNLIQVERVQRDKGRPKLAWVGVVKMIYQLWKQQIIYLFIYHPWKKNYFRSICMLWKFHDANGPSNFCVSWAEVPKSIFYVLFFIGL